MATSTVTYDSSTDSLSGVWEGEEAGETSGYAVVTNTAGDSNSFAVSYSYP